MVEIFMLFLFLLPVFLSIFLCFIRDPNKGRGFLLNTLLIINAIVYLAPLTYAYWATLPDGNMFNENGPGAILWLYAILLPVCILALIIILILKLLFRKKSKKDSQVI